MLAEFEERQFEAFLNAELSDADVPYVPGQVLESIIGFDAALICPALAFWTVFNDIPGALFPAVPVPGGIVLNPKYWKELETAVDLFPPIAFNLFVQHKRPARLGNAKAGQWAHWQQPYYRYELIPHQQAALSALAKIANQDAIVVYACPAFADRASLWLHGFKKTILSQTNFAQAALLDGHSKYTFIEPGGVGWACSNPAEIPAFDLLEEMERRRGGAEEGRSNRRFVALTAKAARQSAKEAGLGDALAELLAYFGKQPPVAADFLAIHGFCALTDSRWRWGFE